MRITPTDQVNAAAAAEGVALTQFRREDGRVAFMDLNGTVYTPGAALDVFYPGGRDAARKARKTGR